MVSSAPAAVGPGTRGPGGEPASVDRARGPTVAPGGVVTLVHEDGAAREVKVAGTFADGGPWPMVRAGKLWRWSSPPLPEGTYAYHFLVDGKRVVDGQNPRRNPKPTGEESVLDVGRGDYPAPPPRPAGPVPRSAAAHGPDELVAVTLNTHSLQERDGRFRKLEQVAEGLAALDADVVALNEVLSGRVFSRGYAGLACDTAAYVKEHLEARTGRGWHLYQRAWATWADGEALGNALLSRWPLAEPSSVELTTRDGWPAPQSRRQCIFARVEPPGGAPLGVFVAHTMGYARPDTAVQVRELKAFVRSRLAPGLAGALVMGDLNVPSRDERHYGSLVRDAPAFVDAFAAAAPFDPHEPTAPDSGFRIDHVFWVPGALPTAALAFEAAVIFRGATYRGCRTPVVSDHYGVSATLRRLGGGRWAG